MAAALEPLAVLEVALIAMTHLRILEPPLSSSDKFLLLHKKHASLVPEFAAALKEMTEDGTLRKLCPPCAESILGPG